MGQYLLKKTIQKHHDSINALAFSPDGLFFASRADDGLIIIFLGNGSGCEVRRFQVKAPVTILLWHSHFGHTLLAGDAAGDVHTISLDGSTSGNPYYHTINCVPGPIHCIVENGIWLAVGSGKAIQLVKQATIATWECTHLLPDPIKFPELDGELPEPMACSLHFLGGGNLLLVMYLDHGVIAWNLKTLEIKWRIHPRTCKIGCSIVSHNEKILALTNLYDGIDWYSLDSNHFMDASYQHTTTHPIPDNVILPITFIHGNSAVLSGTSDGCARITTVTDWLRLRALPIAGDIVQALAYSSLGDAHQIVTGVSERAVRSVIRYWIQGSELKKPAQWKSQGETGRGRAYLTGYTLVSIVIIMCNLLILLAATQLDWTVVSANGAKSWFSTRAN
ncbi:WD40-repeat-containing domain protein [Lactarius sanguifluus]|nr:WD40-repeat-containing domain protein [Lactarius sanguifluus]